MSSTRYVAELTDYEGPVDHVSPYHFYQYTYWNLRGKWRRLLYAWARREPCDAAASIDPEQTVAGNREMLTLTVTVGETPLPRGGRIAVYLPIWFGGAANTRALPCFQGPDGRRGYGSRITAQASREEAELVVQIHSTGSVFTCVEAVVEEGELTEGDRVEILIGDPSCKPPIVCEKAKTYPMRVAIDYLGDDSFRPIVPNPQIANVGNRAHYLRCFAPATPRVGEPFAVRVVAADLPNHNPSHSHAGRLVLKASSGQIDGVTEADFTRESHGTIAVPGVKVGAPGVTRVQVVDEANALMGQTNPICPEAAPPGLSLYYGEIHSHTELSDGGGTPEDSFRWARDVEGLDFSALADHFEDGQSYSYTLEDKWRITREVTEQFDEPGRFVTLLGYEIGTLESHRNVYFADGAGRMVVEGPDGERVTMENVFQKLEGTDYILIPHAPKFHGINWHRPHRPDRQRLVEICSNWGVSEEGGPLPVRHALDLGYKFGSTGGTDNHCSEPGNPERGGITGVYAEELTREAIFRALMARRTFATNGERMILTFSVNGTSMGGELTAGPGAARTVIGRAIACEPIIRVEVIRNGESVSRIEGEGRSDLAVEWRDDGALEQLTPARELTEERFAYYYLRVETVNGTLGWSSPVWVHAT